MPVRAIEFVFDLHDPRIQDICVDTGGDFPPSAGFQG